VTFRAWVAAIVLALGIGTGITIDGSSGAATTSPRTISFFPRAGASGPWEWNPQCPFIPTAQSGCQDSDPVYGSIILNGDLWNIGSTASGDVEMGINSKGQLVTSADFSSAKAERSYTWVRGYPNVSYGVAPQAPSDAPARSQAFALPLSLKQVPSDVIATTNYDVSATSSITYDLSYDIWLEPQQQVEAPTGKTLELMIWTDESIHSLPPGYKEQITMPYALNGVRKSGTWSVYISNGSRASNATTTIELVLRTPKNKAQIGVDFNSAFSNMEKALTKVYPSQWKSFSSYYLDSFSFGTEFGPLTGHASAGPLTWSLDGYSLRVGGHLPAAS
jgi:hypothetical protein